MDNEVMELIDQLYTMVSEAWGVPLGNEKCIVERDQVLEILDEIKTAMPVELSEAKRLVSARDEFINNAKREAEGIRNQAEERARALVDDQEIVRIAKARSNEMLASTQAKADALRRASSQFCDEALRRTEEAISAALGSVQQAHAAFQNVRRQHGCARRCPCSQTAGDPLRGRGSPRGGSQLTAFSCTSAPPPVCPAAVLRFAEIFPRRARFGRFRRGFFHASAAYLVPPFSFFRRETQMLVAGKTTVGLTELSEIARKRREFLLAIFPSCHYNEDYTWGEVV
ncbi:MAG: hypothetical protein V8S57_04485 [Oscillospiraceae bacterium]